MKMLYIMRGLPGSGKSTVAKALGKDGIVFSTDDFFLCDGKYEFNSNKLGLYHSMNINRAREAMEDGITPVVIDNTNVRAADCKPYVEAGLKNGYEIEFVEPETKWKFDLNELVKKNTHNVPLFTIKRMLARWEKNVTVESCLKA